MFLTYHGELDEFLHVLQLQHVFLTYHGELDKFLHVLQLQHVFLRLMTQLHFANLLNVNINVLLTSVYQTTK